MVCSNLVIKAKQIIFIVYFICSEVDTKQSIVGCLLSP